MADDKDKQKYSYRPDIEYQDTYESEHSNRQYKSVPVKDESTEDNNEIMDSITDTFNAISKIIPSFPVELQTAINNVYKPILDDWATIRKEPYPGDIPSDDDVIYEPGIKPPTGESGIGGGFEPGTRPSIGEPDTGDEFYFYPEPPDGITPTPSMYEDDPYIIDNDSMWKPIIPMNIKFAEVDPIDVIRKEYIKNVADLYNYYTNRLKDILYHYYSEKLVAICSKKKNGGNKTVKEVGFMIMPITDVCSDVSEDCKHLFDASLAMCEKSKLKINFLQNAFPLEQTLFHLKNFKTIQELRLRYAKIEPTEGTDNTEALSNNILKGMKISYDQKYDVAFANLYKYLNSTLDILEDATNTELAGIKARRTLIEKGGIKK